MGEVIFTDRELDIMAVLWDRGPSTVSEVREHLADRLAYTTVLTILRTLEGKGHVGHREEGRAHRYHARVARGEAQISALHRLTRKLFSGSSSLLLAHLVGDGDLSERDLKRIRELLDHRLEGKDG